MRLAKTSSSPPSKPFSATVLVSFSRSLFLSHRRLPRLSATGVPSSRNKPYSLGGESHKKGTLSRNLQFRRSKKHRLLGHFSPGWGLTHPKENMTSMKKTRKFKNMIEISLKQLKQMPETVHTLPASHLQCPPLDLSSRSAWWSCLLSPLWWKSECHPWISLQGPSFISAHNYVSHYCM